ncbi:MAG: pyruvate kinase, partial [Methylobacteriaceae bacterium]|nr:pyruvate kinase [Methylobacteriaceae bacterium]
MRRLRRVKIVATLGPASAQREVVAELFRAGADVFRINMSHATHDGMREQVRMIRSLEEEFQRPIAILADLQGPKLRVGEFDGGAAMLAEGASFVLDSDKAPGDAGRVQLPHPEILRSLEPGDTVLIDDGKVRLRIKEATPERAVTLVEVGGRVSNRKGVNLPDTLIPVSAMTGKDRSDLEAALNEGVDWIAVSFVQRAEDIAEVRKIARGRALVLAKIEKPQAIARLDEIIDMSDALMVARG